MAMFCCEISRVISYLCGSDLEVTDLSGSYVWICYRITNRQNFITINQSISHGYSATTYWYKNNVAVSAVSYFAMNCDLFSISLIMISIKTQD